MLDGARPLIDAASWITDPGNPNQVDDGFGGFNSLLDGITCAEWTCAPPLLTPRWVNASSAAMCSGAREIVLNTRLLPGTARPMRP